MKGILIRKANLEDLEVVYNFINELEKDVFPLDIFSRIFESNISDSSIYYFIAEYETTPIGFLSFHIQNLLHHCGKVGEIQEFFVVESMRKMGAGRLLFDEVLQLSETLELKSIEVTSNKNRAVNVDVYQGLGFKLSHNKFTISLPFPSCAKLL
jgi:(aminoalkyl)phosphonate N-acetyltransferase